MRNDAEKADTYRSQVFDNLQHYIKLKKKIEKKCFSSLLRYDISILCTSLNADFTIL